MGQERRRSPRIRQRAECEIELGKKTHGATLLDISEGGLAAVCTEELPVGLAGRITFRVMGKSVEVQALVWHCRQVRFRGEAAHAYGFMLEEASDSFRELLPAETGSASRSASPAATRSSKGEGKTAKGAKAPARDAAASERTERKVSKQAIRAAQSDGAKGKRLGHLRAELDDSMRENRREASSGTFRVRAKMRTQPRTKTLTLSVASEDEARAAVAKQLGEEWEILEVNAA